MIINWRSQVCRTAIQEKPIIKRACLDGYWTGFLVLAKNRFLLNLKYLLNHVRYSAHQRIRICHEKEIEIFDRWASTTEWRAVIRQPNTSLAKQIKVLRLAYKHIHLNFASKVKKTKCVLSLYVFNETVQFVQTPKYIHKFLWYHRQLHWFINFKSFCF